MPFTLFIVSRGDWLLSPANFIEKGKEGKIYVGTSTSVHSLMFCAHTICMAYVTNTFVLVSSPVL